MTQFMDFQHSLNYIIILKYLFGLNKIINSKIDWLNNKKLHLNIATAVSSVAVTQQYKHNLFCRTPQKNFKNV